MYHTYVFHIAYTVLTTAIARLSSFWLRRAVLEPRPAAAALQLANKQISTNLHRSPANLASYVPLLDPPGCRRRGVGQDVHDQGRADAPANAEPGDVPALRRTVGRQLLGQLQAYPSPPGGV